jgi:hypothetical protein
MEGIPALFHFIEMKQTVTHTYSIQVHLLQFSWSKLQDQRPTTTPKIKLIKGRNKAKTTRHILGISPLRHRAMFQMCF